MALQRGDTPDEDDSNMDERKVCSVSEQSFDMMQKRRCINDPEDIFARSNQISNEDPDDASSFANDSAYSFESLIVPYEMEGEIEDLQLSLGMISHKKSLITIFGHKHKIKNFIKNFDIFHEKISTASDFGSYLVSNFKF